MPSASISELEARLEGPAEFIVRAPGRVNLIGEHIDYAGLPVLPMAIDRGITLSGRRRTDRRVRLVNDRPELGERVFDIAAPIPAGPSGDWGNYARAAIQGLVAAERSPAGFEALVTSDLPAAAGLSSSSALVVATALAGLAAAGHAPPSAAADAGRIDLAELLAGAERYVGVRGGGMDQAAILAGRAGCAVLVEFDPLRVRPVVLPEGWAFIVADSLTRAEKAGAARETYNRRRAEVERALGLVAGQFGMEAGGCAALLAAHGAGELLLAGSELPPPLAARFRHVVTEARRVEAAVDRLAAEDARGFGQLLQESHASLRDAFQVSAPALDALVEAALEAGALGARLTGAGLGGCIVALVPEPDVDGFLARLARTFYGPRGVELDGRAFRVRAADGAAAVGPT